MVSALAVTLLAGCAVADYQQPVETLNTAITESADTVRALDEKLTRLQNDRWGEEIRAGTLMLDTAKGSCAAGLAGCSLHVLSTDPSKEPRTFPATSLMPRARLALQGLTTYAGRLKSITDADTAAKVTTSANAALGSIQNLAKTIADETGDKTVLENVTAFQEPAVVAIQWLVSRYVEYVKFKALAEATKRAHPVILVLSDWMDTSANAVALAEFTDAHTRFVKAQEEFDNVAPGQLSKSAIDAYVTAAAEYDVALKATAARPLREFTVAHEQLMKVLNREGDVDFADASAAIERLGEEAKAFKKVIEGLEQAIEAQGGS